MTRAYGNTVNGYWRVYFDYTVDNSYSGTHARVTLGFGVYWVKAVKGNTEDTYYNCADDYPSYVHCDWITRNASSKAVLKNSGYKAGSSYPYFATQHFLIEKQPTQQTITIGAYINHNSKNTLYKGTSNVDVSVTIAACQKYTISFDKNTLDKVTGMPDPVIKYQNEPLILPKNVPINESLDVFLYWYREDDPNTWYEAGAAYFLDGDATLKAAWSANTPPTVEWSSVQILPSNGTNIIGGYSKVSVQIDGAEPQEQGRYVTKILMLVSINGVPYQSDILEPPFSFPQTLDVDFDWWRQHGDDVKYGEASITIRVIDNEGGIRNETIMNLLSVRPTWSQEVVVSNNEFPRLRYDGSPIIDKLEVKNYTTDPPSYDTLPATGLNFIKHGTEYAIGTTWGFTFTFDEDHVDPDSADMTTPNVDVKVSYRNYKSEVSKDGQAFFETSRNKNYSNGIYNIMFVSGVNQDSFSDYTSRVWWSKYNNPLYFPDTNYIEVGSNDTAVQGLTKVGDYLGVVKQSKTTDTAIFLLYPTSFEEDTTFAVKQGVQGVGALSRYSFNILGDETLFLSPKGVVAVIPTDDEEHKVQNRSYFVDKKMLNEPNIESSFSFVHDGKYYLAMGSHDGSVYVLDGNQRNSWGNDRTNLVYECYYLENIPATSFAKFNDRLVFTDGVNVCIFNDGYTDAYDKDGRANVPVYARWTTIFDDDNALHYYKTMQKKGNLISILPLEDQYPYKAIGIDEEVFDADKEKYFVIENNKYVNCKNKTYDPTATYYIENRTGTKVYVKKDDNEKVEIERKFGLLSSTPSELFINKKFKKYKRLQFIIENGEAENFGIDEIVKNYTVGNYAKK